MRSDENTPGFLVTPFIQVKKKHGSQPAVVAPPHLHSSCTSRNHVWRVRGFLPPSPNTHIHLASNNPGRGSPNPTPPSFCRRGSRGPGRADNLVDVHTSVQGQTKNENQGSRAPAQAYASTERYKPQGKRCGVELGKAQSRPSSVC